MFAGNVKWYGCHRKEQTKQTKNKTNKQKQNKEPQCDLAIPILDIHAKE